MQKIWFFKYFIEIIFIIFSSQNVQPSVSNNSLNREYNQQPPPSSSSVQKNNDHLPISNKNPQSASSSSIKEANSSSRQNQAPSRPITPEIKPQTLPHPQLSSGSTTTTPASLNPQVNTMERSKSTNNPNSNQKSAMLARSATLNENNNSNNKNPHNNILKSVQSIGSSEDGDDTMNNLRKTFAGIFGNSNL